MERPFPWELLGDAARLRAANLFVAEGRGVVERVLKRPSTPLLPALEVVRVLASLPAVGALRLDERVADRLDVRSPADMQAVTGFNFHRGVVALVRRPAPLPVDTLLASLTARPLVVCEQLVDVDNVGSVFRNARALGGAAVVLDDACADPLYRKAVRTSMGAVFDVPWTVTPRDVLYRQVRDAGYRLLALTPDSHATPYPEVIARAGVDRLALVIGNEGAGLREETMQACDIRTRIPMAPGADSLNVATALAVALYGLGVADRPRD